MSALPNTRLHPTWTFKQSLTLHIVHDMVDTEARVGVTEELTLCPGDDGDRFQVIEPFASDVYQGPLASSTVIPTKIGGVWFPSVRAAADSKNTDTIVLWIHVSEHFYTKKSFLCRSSGSPELEGNKI